MSNFTVENLMDTLQEWREDDHADAIHFNFSRNEVIELLEDFKRYEVVR